MTDQVKPGQVWASKNTGRQISIVRPGPVDDSGDTRGRWQWVSEGMNPDYGTWLIADFILFSDFVLLKDAP